MWLQNDPVALCKKEKIMKVVDREKALRLIHQYVSPDQMMNPETHFDRMVGEAVEVNINTNCKNCAAPLNYDKKFCEYCSTQIKL